LLPSLVWPPPLGFAESLRLGVSRAAVVVSPGVFFPQQASWGSLPPWRGALVFPPPWAPIFAPAPWRPPGGPKFPPDGARLPCPQETPWCEPEPPGFGPEPVPNLPRGLLAPGPPPGSPEISVGPGSPRHIREPPSFSSRGPPWSGLAQVSFTPRSVRELSPNPWPPIGGTLPARSRGVYWNTTHTTWTPFDCGYCDWKDVSNVECYPDWILRSAGPWATDNQCNSIWVIPRFQVVVIVKHDDNQKTLTVQRDCHSRAQQLLVSGGCFLGQICWMSHFESEAAKLWQIEKNLSFAKTNREKRLFNAGSIPQ